jgi:hypothetical protein
MTGKIAIVMLSLALLMPMVSARDSDEQQAVRKPLELYLQAHATGKGEYILQAFSPDAKILFVQNGKYSQFTREEFAARFDGKPAADEEKRVRRIVSVDITGTAANAKILLDYPKVTFTDYMSLLKIDGEWKIVNKIFNAQPKPNS